MIITTPQRSGTHSVTPYLMEMKCPLYFLHFQCSNLCPVSSSPCRGSPTAHGTNWLPAQRSRQPSCPFFKITFSSICWRRPCRNTRTGARGEGHRMSARPSAVGMRYNLRIPIARQLAVLVLEHCHSIRGLTGNALRLTSTWPHWSSISSRNVVFSSRLRSHCAHTLPYLPAATTRHIVHRFGGPPSRTLVYIDCDETRSERGRLRRDLITDRGISPTVCMPQGWRLVS
jgi:hypothetical protein